MAIKRFAGDKFSGLSTDTKPTGVLSGATFWEIDTQKVFVYDGTDWEEIDYVSEIAWGDITGTLADQTDLQAALDDKLEEGDISRANWDTAYDRSPTDLDLTGNTLTLTRQGVGNLTADLSSLDADVDWGDIGGTLSDQTDLNNALNDKVDTSAIGAANGVAPLDGDSKVPAANLPAIAFTEVYVVADIAARDALNVEEGDVAVVTDASDDPDVDSGSATYIYDGTDWQKLKGPDISAAGADTQVQYNDSGELGASANFTFGSNILGLVGNLRISEGVAVTTPNHDQATYYVETETVGSDDITRVKTRLGNGDDVIIASYIQ